MKSTYYSVPRRGWSRRNYAIAASILGWLGIGALYVGTVVVIVVGLYLLAARP